MIRIKAGTWYRDLIAEHRAKIHKALTEAVRDVLEKNPEMAPEPAPPRQAEPAKRARASDWIIGMDDAPRDGTVIEACGRNPNFTAGYPIYVHWFGDAWRPLGRGVMEPVICWAWRPRTAWPEEPR